MRMRTVVVLCAALTLAIACGPAAAKIKKSAAEVKLGPGASGAAKARCSKGTALISTGFDTANDDPAAVVFNHGLVPRRKSVKAIGTNTGSAASTEVAKGACAAGIRTKIRSVRADFVEGKLHNVFAECSKGELALSGGYKLVGPEPKFWSAMNSVRAGDSEWVSSIGGEGTVGAGKIRAFVICTRERLELKTEFGPEVASSPDKFSVSKAKCAKGSVALSGGFNGGGDEGASTANMAIPQSSHRAGKRGWAVRATSRGIGSTIRARVYCIKKGVL